jgi:TetR/AcrR family transcriptional repressor of nem operon
MRGAGLTTGGFYAHFPSKTAMDVAIVQTLLHPLLGLTDLDGAAGLEWLQRAVKRYLSVAHRDNVDGCGYPAVLSEIASAPSEVRRAFAEALEIRVNAFQPHVPPTGVTARERALATMALTIGGLLLARAAKGTPISEELLSACRSWALPEAVREKGASRG